MTRNIVVSTLPESPFTGGKVEIVERKGVGHPDSLADGIAESVSRALCREYLERFDRILHHNTDEVQLVAGEAKPEFGGGEVIRPIYILITGRATAYVGDEEVPVGTIALRAAREYLDETVRHLDVDRHVVLEPKIGHGSADLRDVFERGEEVPLANDTSFGVGFAPLTTTERLVYETERFINSDRLKKELPEVGEDVKVMGLREGDTIELTIAAAMVSRLIDDLDHYVSVVEELKDRVKDLVAELAPDADVTVHVNTADDYERGTVYLTVTGTSAEQGDDGSVGRGNRVNGLITPCRPMSMEAAAGKNPVNHVGKLYNVLAHRMARRIYEETSADEVYVRLLSQIGRPIDDPKTVDVQLVGDVDREDVRRAERVAEELLDGVTELTREFVEGKVEVF
ncbi:methionine adenosyltransferase [Methanopyrus sp.]